MMEKKRQEICPTCKGTGKTFRDKSIYDWGWKICEVCNGNGFIEINPPPRQIRIGRPKL